MRKQRNILIFIFSNICLCLCLCICIAPILAFAKATKADLFYNDKKQDIMISISWETNDVSVTLIDPSGKSIDPGTATDTLSSVISDTGMFVMIKDAAEGQWQWNYDKGSNESLDVSVSKYKEPVWIQNFKLGAVSGSTVPFDFNTSSEEDIYYDYSITIKTSTETAAVKEIYYGSAAANEQVTGMIDLSSINTYSNYILELKVSYNDNGLDYFDLADSEPFSYANPKQIAGINDFELILNESSGTVSIGNVMLPDGYYDEIIARIYEDGNSILEKNYSLDAISTCTAGIDEGVKEIKVGLTLVSGGIMSQELVKTCTLQPSEKDFTLILPDYNISNQNTYKVAYSNAKAQSVTVNVNGMEDSWILEGNGEKLLELPEGQSEIVLTYYDSQNIIRKLETSVSIDVYPPELNIIDDFDGMITSKDSIIITGETEVGSSVTINGAAVELKNSGTFLYTYTLKNGDNNITISSKDGAGNEAAYYACVTKKIIVKSNSFLKDYFPLITSLAASVVGIILIALLTRKKRKTSPEEINADEAEKHSMKSGKKKDRSKKSGKITKPGKETKASKSSKKSAETEISENKPDSRTIEKAEPMLEHNDRKGDDQNEEGQPKQ